MSDEPQGEPAGACHASDGSVEHGSLSHCPSLVRVCVCVEKNTKYAIALQSVVSASVRSRMASTASRT